MPSRHHKFLVRSPPQSSQTPVKTPDDAQSAQQVSPFTARSQARRREQEEVLYNVPVLTSEVALDLNPRCRPANHSRSFSHPFLSVLGSGRGSDRTPSSSRNDGESENVGNRAIGIPSASDVTETVMPALRSPHEAKIEPENDIGQCPTCNSTLRWPRGISVFRCTVCLMVSDLQSHRDHAAELKSCTSTAFTNLKARAEDSSQSKYNSLPWPKIRVLI